MPGTKLPYNFIDPSKCVKVKNYVNRLPAAQRISVPTAYKQARAGQLKHVEIDGVLHIITE